MTETWFPTTGSGGTVLDEVIGHRPAYGTALRDVEAALWSQDVLEPAILELCRLRIARLLGAEGEERATPGVVAESAVRALSRWPTAPEFDDRQRVCLAFAEQLLMDAQGVTDEQVAQVIDAVGEGGFLVLAYGCGFFETTQRARLVLAAGGGS